MPPRPWRVRVADILGRIDRIESYTTGLDFDSFVEDDLRTDAVMRCFEIIGEAAWQIPEEIRLRHREIPWSLMRRMRNLLTHAYLAADLGIVWGTLTNDLPAVRPRLEALLESEPDDVPSASPEPPFGRLLPRVTVPPPGPRSRRLAGELARWESPNVTYLGDEFPVFWAEARGANVRDADGNVYVDLTAAFAVAGAGHAHPRIVEAVRAQAGRLLHGMGDVHPPAVKVDVLRALAEVTPPGLTRGILGSSGAEAVEAALKTAAIATGKPRVLAFHGGYHGLTYGALDVSAREDFRAPFSAQLRRNAVFAPYPYPYRSPFGGGAEAVAAATLRYVEHLLDTPGTASEDVGAVLVEPVQGRGGDLVPHESFLPGLRRLCDQRGLLLILDEVYTGFGRTGRWFACEHTGVVPDLLVVGKALTGGLPFAACVGTDRVMEAWPRSRGEAIHTSTFLGNPVACAAALASIAVLREERLVERSAELGARILSRLRDTTADHPHVGEVRGVGMMIGVEMVRDRATREPAPELVGRIVVEALKRGVLVLGGGIHGSVLSLSPPFVITDEQVDAALGAIGEILDGMR